MMHEKLLKSIFISLACLIIFFLSLLLIFTKKSVSNSYVYTKYVIPSVMYKDYENIKREIQEQYGIDTIYIEKIKSYYKDNVGLEIREVNDFKAIKHELDKGLESGRMPKNNKEIIIGSDFNGSFKDYINNEGILKGEFGDYYCSVYYTNKLSCYRSNIEVTNVRNESYKVVGKFSGIPSEAYTLLDVDSLNKNDRINIIVEFDKYKLYKDKVYDPNSINNMFYTLVSKYSTEYGDNCENDPLFSNINKGNTCDVNLYEQSFYSTDGSSYDIDSLLNNKLLNIIIIIVLVILYTLLALNYLKLLNMNKLLTNMVIGLIIVILSIYGYLIIDAKNKYLSTFGNYSEARKIIIYEDNLDEIYDDLLKSKGVTNIDRDNNIFKVTHNKTGYINIIKYFIKNNINYVTLDSIVWYDNECSFINLINLLKWMMITHILIVIDSLFIIILRLKNQLRKC